MSTPAHGFFIDADEDPRFTLDDEIERRRLKRRILRDSICERCTRELLFTKCALNGVFEAPCPLEELGEVWRDA